nr:hypothetical protein [Weissella fangxianensis]
MVLEIIILEDSQHQLTWISNFIKRYTEFEELDTSIKLVTSDVRSIKKFVKMSNHQNILFFLNAESLANDFNIIELGKYIRHWLPLASLVFINGHEKLSTLILEHRLSPLDCISKNKSFDEIEESIREDINIALGLVVSHMKNNPEKFVYNCMRATMIFQCQKSFTLLLNPIMLTVLCFMLKIKLLKLMIHYLVSKKGTKIYFGRIKDLLLI